MPPAAEPRIAGLPARWFHVAVGIPVALVLTYGPILRFIGWFLRSLVHEMGHAALAWFAGCPAVPAIRLDGHAAAVHQGQVLPLALAVWAGLAFLAWRAREDRPRLVLLAAAAALYPLVAFTGLREILHLAAGHLGELAFATVFFWRALRGGFAHELERPLYAGLGWYWMVGSIWLFGSLVLSESTRQWYLTNGSFGMENDFVRIAAKLGVSLPAAAFPMIPLSFLPLPIAWWLERGARARPATSPWSSA